MKYELSEDDRKILEYELWYVKLAIKALAVGSAQYRHVAGLRHGSGDLSIAPNQIRDVRCDSP